MGRTHLIEPCLSLDRLPSFRHLLAGDLSAIDTPKTVPTPPQLSDVCTSLACSLNTVALAAVSLTGRLHQASGAVALCYLPLM
jgi:hypothetical protein